MAVLLSTSIATQMTVRPRAVLERAAYKMRVPYELKQGQSRIFHELPSGLKMEVIFQEGVGAYPEEEKGDKFQNPPLVFVHGSFHAAWCWAEHWLPFFSHSGYDCYAISLLGQVTYLSLSPFKMNFLNLFGHCFFLVFYVLTLNRT